MAFFLLYKGQNKAEYYDARANAYEGICYVKDIEVYEAAVYHIDHVSENNAVYHIANTSANEHSHTDFCQHRLLAIFKKIYKDRYDSYRGRYHKHPSMLGQHTEGGALVPYIRYMKYVLYNGDGLSHGHISPYYCLNYLIDADRCANDGY